MNTKLLSYLFVALGAAFLAYKVTTNHYVAKIATMKTEQADQAAAIAKSNYDDLRAANSLADVLSQTLANQEQAINTLTLEKTREIKHYSTGNICFSSDLTRLLNTPVSEAAAGATPSTSTAKSTTATTAQSEQIENESTGEVLTDYDIAQWIANAQGLYATCRSRLSGLIDFEIGLKD